MGKSQVHCHHDNMNPFCICEMWPQIQEISPLVKTLSPPQWHFSGSSLVSGGVIYTFWTLHRAAVFFFLCFAAATRRKKKEARKERQKLLNLVVGRRVGRFFLFLGEKKNPPPPISRFDTFDRFCRRVGEWRDYSILPRLSFLSFSCFWGWFSRKGAFLRQRRGYQKGDIATLLLTHFEMIGELLIHQHQTN